VRLVGHLKRNLLRCTVTWMESSTLGHVILQLPRVFLTNYHFNPSY